MLQGGHSKPCLRQDGKLPWADRGTWLNFGKSSLLVYPLRGITLASQFLMGRMPEAAASRLCSAFRSSNSWILLQMDTRDLPQPLLSGHSMTIGTSAAVKRLPHTLRF